MTGGQLQLNSYKGNRSFLNARPQTSFFKKVFYQYNNYAKILFTLDFKQDIDDINIKNFSTKSKYHLKIPKNGDLIKEFYIYVTLPEIQNPLGGCSINDNYCGIKWINDLQFKIINSIKFKIGGQTIQEFDSETLYFYYTLLFANEKKGLLNYISNQEYINSANSTAGYLPKIKLAIPIPVWFFDIPFPIVCLKFMDLEIELELNSIYDLLLVREKNFKTLPDTTEINIEPWRRMTDKEHENNNLVENNFKLSPEIKINYIFLEKKELVNYFTYKNKYLIEIYRKTNLDDIKSHKNYDSKTGILKYNYETIGCTRDLIIATRKTSSSLFNQHFNFTNLDDINNSCYDLHQNYFLKSSINQWDLSGGGLLKYLEDFIIDTTNAKKDISGLKFPTIYTDAGSPANVIVDYDQAFKSSDILSLREQWNFRDISGNINKLPIIDNTFKTDIIEELQVKFNNIERIEFKDKSYFQELEFFKNYPSCNKNSIYVINFSFFPDLKKPSGQCNFSHIQKVQLDLKLNLKTNENYELLIYNRYYNILELAAGSAKFIYFK